MLYNYIKTGLRNLLRNRIYTAINLVGLAIGIASCLLIFLFVKDEVTFDAYHSKADQIYKLQTSTTRNGEITVMQGTSFPEGEAFKEEIPTVLNYARLASAGATIKQAGDYLDEKRMVIADPSIFQMFDFRLKAGSLDLIESDLVLTETAALKYFGEEDCIDKELLIDRGRGVQSYIVKAVIEDHPSNSSFYFDILMPIKQGKPAPSSTRNYWFYNGWTTFLELRKDVDLEVLKTLMDKVRETRNPGEEGPEAFAKESSNELLPLKDMHSKASENYNNGLKASVKAQRSYALLAISLLILIIACFNFSNLTFVSAIKRTKEVGIRKTVGALSKNLFVQFLIEAGLVGILAFVVGIVLAEVALPFFEGIMQKQFSRHFLQDSGLLLFAFSLVILAIFLAVSYPTLVLSRLKVTSVFKGMGPAGNKSLITRVMVGLQFVMAIVFIIVASGIQKQHSYLMNKQLGYTDENLIRLTIPATGSEGTAKRLSNALGANPNILGVGATGGFNEMTELSKSDKEKVKVLQAYATPEWLDVMQLELIEGRNLTVDDRLNDGSVPTNVLINSSTVEELGLKEPIGQLLSDGNYKIVGVFEDFQVFSAKSNLNNALVRANPLPGNNFFLNKIYVRFQPSFLSNVLTSLEDSWKEVLPTTPFNYEFVETYNDNLYEKEALWSRVLEYASGLAISVSLFGVLGLIGQSANQRRKEISIRKVLGANEIGLTLLLNQGFSRLLLLSLIISLSISYYIIDAFLRDYVNRMEISLGLFILPATITVLLVWSIVSLVTFRSARKNPIEDLRYE